MKKERMLLRLTKTLIVGSDSEKGTEIMTWQRFFLWSSIVSAVTVVLSLVFRWHFEMMFGTRIAYLWMLGTAITIIFCMIPRNFKPWIPLILMGFWIARILFDTDASIAAQIYIRTAGQPHYRVDMEEENWWARGGFIVIKTEGGMFVKTRRDLKAELEDPERQIDKRSPLLGEYSSYIPIEDLGDGWYLLR